MELKQIKELMSMMERTGTKRLMLKREDFELQLEREDKKSRLVDEGPFEVHEETTHKNEMAIRRANILSSRGNTEGHLPPLSNVSSKEDDRSNSNYITSPMVGTFYTAGAAGDSPFVKVGDLVENETIVCIIEAMKVMNEIKSNVSGTVSELLVENGHPVEFGTKLFRIS